MQRSRLMTESFRRTGRRWLYAATEKRPDRKEELEGIADICAWVPENPPRTFAEAVQFFSFIHLIRYVEYSALGVGIRIDQFFGPYYEKDIQESRITREDALDFIQLL